MQSMPPSGSRVAFYSRYSTDRQNQNSIDGQERLCANYASERGWREVGRYSDAERSGTTTHGRAGLFKMLQAAELGEFDVLLVEDIDRASRDAADMHFIAKQLEELEVVLCTVSGGVVSDIELAFKAVQNQQFIKQNVAKSKRGQELAISQGRMSGSVAYGYRKVAKFDDRGEPINGLREIDPDKAEIVQRIHHEFDAGRTTFEICKTLNAEGVPSPKGKLWRPGALLGNRQGGIGILRNPIYIGQFQFRKTHRRFRKGEVKMTFKSETERLISDHPELRIIDQELWDRNQARLAEHLDRPFFRKKRNRFAFSGMVFCGECGSTAIVSGGKYLCTGRRDKGICTNTRRVFREAVEETVFQKIKQHILDTAVLGPALDAFRDEVQRAHADQAEKLESQTAALQDVEARISNLTDQLSNASESVYASQMLIKKLDQLGAEKRQLETQIQRTPPPVPIGETDEIIAAISDTIDELSANLQADEAEAARAKELLRGLVSRIVLTPIGPQKDGRGSGDLRVTVEGPIANLIDLSDLSTDRVTKNGHRPMFELDNANFVWTFSYELQWEDTRLDTVRSDLEIIGRLLDEADVPVSMDVIVEALAEEDESQGVVADRSPAHRARNAVAYLQDQALTRCINVRSADTGYVWNERHLTDAEWKARIAEPPVTRTIPVIRVLPPEAVVVLVS
ncbi:Site-specific recombinase and resolvase superfamily protein [Oceanicaulis alexandrii HTCC2633]|uniref:recombinase family protein n=1 Tax=Oceanicaulis sp. HTCC2633 TaxID=314254 RepID=UPI0000668B4F|nr:recombinase family protein [Oceanicaulis sp. HTCC2633]EAP90301.1 Site-specific recombinase and resolvase superfamily protein [Oceanicaulis alexandrii HTCC2633] [Oceanicaulis sp. HTCC2633]